MACVSHVHSSTVEEAISGEAIVVKEPKEEFDLVRDPILPNPAEVIRVGNKLLMMVPANVLVG